jgi:hypothetical protein
MGPGDIILYEGQRWKVQNRSRSARVCLLSNWEGQQTEVVDDADRRLDSGVTLLYQPSTWPFLAVPQRPRFGRIIEVQRRGEKLEPLEDWVPSGLFSSGGSLFFNPTLRLRLGEVLTLIHERGRSRAAITRSFGTARFKRRRAAGPWEPREPTSAYDRLMSDDDPFEGQ